MEAPGRKLTLWAGETLTPADPHPCRPSPLLTPGGVGPKADPGDPQNQWVSIRIMELSAGEALFICSCAPDVIALRLRYFL